VAARNKVVMMLLFFASFVCGAKAQVNLWNADWQLDASHSDPESPVFVLSKEHDFLVVNNGRFRFEFRCDGKNYPITLGDTINCIQESKRQMTLIIKRRGRNARIDRDLLSADGLGMRQTITKIEDTGVQKKTEKFLRRVVATDDFMGAWYDKSVSTRPGRIVTYIKGGKLLLRYENEKQYAVMDIGGPAAPLRGPNVHEAVSMSAKEISNTTLVIEQRSIRGVLYQATLAMGADGNTLAITISRPQRPAARQKLVYIRARR